MIKVLTNSHCNDDEEDQTETALVETFLLCFLFFSCKCEVFELRANKEREQHEETQTFNFQQTPSLKPGRHHG